MNKSLKHVIHTNVQGIYLTQLLPATCDQTMPKQTKQRNNNNKIIIIGMYSFLYPKILKLY